MCSATVPPPPTLECDLVMKGGVTSGVVYPSAVAAIAERYRLRSIGGTSAGAIGAAGAAAMEFGRLSGRNPNSVAMMAGLSGQLGAPDDKGVSLLSRLFEPDPPTAPMFRRLKALAGSWGTNGVTGVVAHLLALPFVGSLLVCLIGATALVTLAGYPLHGSTGIVLLLAVLLGTLVLTVTVVVCRWGALIRHGLRAAGEDGFGICSGMASHGEGNSKAPSLATWLHTQYQALAGLPEDQPLCFGDLWAARHRREEVDRDDAFARAAASDALDCAKRDVSLTLVV